MTDDDIQKFFTEIERILVPNGHVMFWVDKFILLNSLKQLTGHTDLQLIDMLTWNKGRMGMGYRTRRKSEYLVIFQKPPIKAKDVWKRRNIPDVWDEKITDRTHPHSKPIELQKALIEAVTLENDIVVDPTAGSYSTLVATKATGRNFLGCDLLG